MSRSIGAVVPRRLLVALLIAPLLIGTGCGRYGAPVRSTPREAPAPIGPTPSAPSPDAAGTQDEAPCETCPVRPALPDPQAEPR